MHLLPLRIISSPADVLRGQTWKCDGNGSHITTQHCGKKMIEDGTMRMQGVKNAIVGRLEDSLHGRQPLSSAERVRIEKACRELVLLRNHQKAA